MGLTFHRMFCTHTLCIIGHRFLRIKDETRCLICIGVLALCKSLAHLKSQQISSQCSQICMYVCMYVCVNVFMLLTRIIFPRAHWSLKIICSMWEMKTARWVKCHSVALLYHVINSSLIIIRSSVMPNKLIIPYLVLAPSKPDQDAERLAE